MSNTPATSVQRPQVDHRVRGDLGKGDATGGYGFWGFLFCDMVVFTGFFITAIYERGQDPAVFAHGNAELSMTFGVVNTVLLLSASLFVALAVQSIRQARTHAGRWLLAAAGVCGTAFTVNKGFEWSAKVSAGRTPQDDFFFQLYYVLTGFHLAHVIVGVVVLCFQWHRAGRIKPVPTDTDPARLERMRTDQRFVESGANYWHLVDLLWLVLFALFYLI
ncbi:hypothetical protein GCM10022267_89270 [Lentzea roselyniae]|uniref:Cytochrome aa3 subunit 3 n=1 Tax=Lentzea roselyniae TaxID=531940 RepID=A0ABP7CH60_9PSEU